MSRSIVLFLLVLEVLLGVVKSNKKINGLKIFKYEFCYTVYADDATFFLKNQKSVIEVLKVFERSSKISRLKPKWE